MPRLGKIAMGRLVPNKSGNGTHPEPTEGFVIKVSEAAEQNLPGLTARIAEQLGEEPQSLDIVLVGPAQESAPQNFKNYGGNGLRCVGDGFVARAQVVPQVFERWMRGEDEQAPPPIELWVSGQREDGDVAPEEREITCFGSGYEGAPPCPMLAAKKCRPVMNLQFAMPDVPGVGVWQLDVGSEISIERVNSALAMLQGMAGRVNGIPLKLGLEQITVSPEGRKKKVRVLRLDFAFGSWRDVMELSSGAGADLGLLPAPEAPADDESTEPLEVDVIEPPLRQSAVRVPESDNPREDPPREPVEAVDVDDLEEAQAFVDRMKAEHHFPSDELVFQVVGVPNLAGIVLIGVDAAQSVIDVKDTDRHKPGAVDDGDVLGDFKGVPDFLMRTFQDTGLTKTAIVALDAMLGTGKNEELLAYPGGLDALYARCLQEIGEREEAAATA